LALPNVRGGDDHPTKIHACRTVSMRPLRFFVISQPNRPSDILHYVAAFVCSCHVHELARTRLAAIFAPISRAADNPSCFYYCRFSARVPTQLYRICTELPEHSAVSFPSFYFLPPVLFLLWRRSRDRLTFCEAKTGLCCVVGSTVDHSGVIGAITGRSLTKCRQVTTFCFSPVTSRLRWGASRENTGRFEPPLPKLPSTRLRYTRLRANELAQMRGNIRGHWAFTSPSGSTDWRIFQHGWEVGDVPK
jgi:hypothetical protein